MKRPLLSASVTALFVVLDSACIESPQEIVSYEAVAVPTGSNVRTVNEWTVTLARADIALGPFYFCAAASGSSTLCESSIAELRTVTVVDGIAKSPVRLGRVEGFTGVIKSAAFDYGISWFDTQTAPTAGTHSMHIEGIAENRASKITFVADVDIVPQYQGQNAIPTAPADANVSTRTTRLEVHIDPARWFGQVDFEGVRARGETTLVIAPGTLEHNQLLLGIKNLAPPELRWVD
jgi:hypothetical protein